MLGGAACCIEDRQRCEPEQAGYEKGIEGFGGKGYLVEAPEDIAPALEDAFASGRTACINVMTDPEPISPGSLALAAMGGYDVSKFMGSK